MSNIISLTLLFQIVQDHRHARHFVTMVTVAMRSVLEAAEVQLLKTVLPVEM